MNETVNSTQLERAYRLLSPVYDVVFGHVFHRGRRVAIECADLQPGERVLEVGFGTGLNLALYPAHCQVVGIDASPEMLERAQRRIDRLGAAHVEVETMDATDLRFADDSFDKVIATYLVSAVPEPVKVLQEMHRVVKPGGSVVVYNHFRSEGPVRRRLEQLVTPICRHLGWQADLELEPLLQQAGMHPELKQPYSVLGGLLDGWQLLRFKNGAEPPDAAAHSKPPVDSSPPPS